ncbi:hypothetical protein H257_14556 [Aphanomyces astaci]|uniref:Uncharacterized protein n=1 Tax=Aphanomyces astaci TaxID=112090 RepID=W4FST2_APHAT|nr:hypothetical protein H257_14556 [Aphanomyces astaci]ETV69693.1 hypothetical protein H257_14556 [Aphanomyces astaci]|eukprot:XP_009840707.1 hypothetical protein H257_14556 [Aphanomyces astaci]
MQQPPLDQSPLPAPPTSTPLSLMSPPMTAAKGLTIPSDGLLHAVPVATTASILILKPTRVVTQDQSASYSQATSLAMPLHSPNASKPGRRLVVLRVGILYRATFYCN